MPRATLDERALRLVEERRVRIDRVQPNDTGRGERRWLVEAHVRGENDDYSVGWHLDRGWRCSCEANAKFGRRCSHIRAVSLVIVPPR